MKKFLSIIVPIIFFLFIANIAFATNTSIEITNGTETTYKTQIKTNEGTWQDTDNTDPPKIDYNGNITIRGYAYYLNETGDRTTQVTEGNVTIGPTKSSEVYCGNLDGTGYNFECTVDTQDVIPDSCHIGENCTIYIWVNDTSGLEGNRSLKLWIRDLNITDEYDNEYLLTFSSDRLEVNTTVTISGYVYYKKELDEYNVSIPISRTSYIYIKDPCEQETYGSGNWSTSRTSTDTTGKFSFNYKPNCTGSNLKFWLKARDSYGIESYITIRKAVYPKNTTSTAVDRDIETIEIENIPKLIKDVPTAAVFSLTKIQEIKITTNKRVLLTEITIEELGNSTTTKPEGKLYQYINITKVNLTDSDISKVEIKFKVSKSWIEANNVDPNTIKLIKYSGSKWNDINTSLRFSDNNYYYYNSTSDSLSMYAITGQEKVVIPGIKESDYLNITTYPTTISIEQGKNKTESVTVKNINTTVNQSVKLTITDINSSWYTVTPDSAIISPNTNKIFNITFIIPSDAEMKDYNIKYNASSSYDYTTENFTLSIIPGDELKKTINETLANYSAIFNDIEIEYNETKNKGINSTTLDTLYNDLKTKLNSAVSFRDSGDYKSAYNLLDDINEDLTKTQQEIDKIIKQEQGLLGSLTRKIIIFTIIGVITAFIIYLFLPPSIQILPKLTKKGRKEIREEEGLVKDRFDEEFEDLEKSEKNIQGIQKDRFDEEFEELEKNQ